MQNITFTQAKTANDLHQILALQSANLPQNISKSELANEGFVTVQHSFELLKAMNTPYSHIIAKDGEEVIAYALVMLRDFADRIPVLFSMFEMINQSIYNDNLVHDSTYFAMGQVCIDKAYRGKGIFKKLYQTMQKYYSNDFHYLITEIAARNPRSLKAHAKVGFEDLKIFTDEKTGEVWHLVIWDWNRNI
ncbi:MAG: N-acetyltransferase family protein [Saprospiraceae bacterium]